MQTVLYLLFRSLCPVRDRSNLNLRPLLYHSFFGLRLRTLLSFDCVLVEFATEEEHVSCAEAVSDGVDASSICHGVREFLVHTRYDFVEKWEYFFGRVSC